MHERIFSLIMVNLLTSFLIVLLSVALFALKTRVSAVTKYFLWLFILLGLIFPFRPHFGQGLLEVPFQSLPGSRSVAYTTASDSVSRSDFWGRLSPSFWLFLLLFIWLIGCLWTVSRQILAYYRFRQMLKHWGQPVTDDLIKKRLESSRRSLGIRASIELLVCPTLKSPMLTGFRRPTIILPETAYTDEELDLIFEHELTHFKHHDLYTNLLTAVILTLHWFNPIVRFACKEMQEAAEAYCDDAVLHRHQNDFRFFYSETILTMVDRSKRELGPLTTCFYSNKFNLRRRILTIMESGRSLKMLSPVLTFFLFLALLGSGSVFALTSQQLSGTGSQTLKTVFSDDTAASSKTEEKQSDSNSEAETDPFVSSSGSSQDTASALPESPDQEASLQPSAETVQAEASDRDSDDDDDDLEDYDDDYDDD
ncbi:M56 family metallopeptidase [Streptococcus sp. H31]|uniref:M56 family metallopeptidase n=1 Tax=Streptococcus huangxiaojuni TaxID=3237239 RepID=UPI0034A44BAF